jgi:hypothetical protein
VAGRRSRHDEAMRFLFWLAACSLVLGAGCATSSATQGASSPSAPAAAEPEEPEPEGIEDGIKAIHDYIRDANEAIEAKHFKEATHRVRRAERAVQKASDLTRAHPEFEDSAEMVERARHHLDDAINQDRLARRQQAIAELTRIGTEAVARGNNIAQQLKVRIGTDEDVDNLREIVTVLIDLKDKGAPYVDDPGFGAHTIARDRQVELLQTLVSRTKWQIRASAGVDHPMEQGVRAGESAQKAETQQDKIALLRESADCFVQCATVVAELEKQPLYTPDLLVQTPLGPAPMGSIKAACQKRARQMRSEADGLLWQGQVAPLIDDIKKAVQEYRTIQDSTQALRIAESTLATLNSCRASVHQLMQSPGADPNRKFDLAPLGTVTVPALAETCQREAAKIGEAMPGLTWRIEFENARDRANQAQSARQAGSHADSAKKQVELYREALGGLHECVERVAALRRNPKVPANLKVKSAYGEVNLAGLEKNCGQEVKTIESLLATAQQAEKLEEFIATCRGDEIEVARREGMPTRVDALANGRVFVYTSTRGSKKKGSERRFAFDSSGRRTME